MILCASLGCLINSALPVISIGLTRSRNTQCVSKQVFIQIIVLLEGLPPTNLMCISVGKQGLGADRCTETETVVKTSNIHASSGKMKTLNLRGKGPKIQQWMIWTELCKWPQFKFKSIANLFALTENEMTCDHIVRAFESKNLNWL